MKTKFTKTIPLNTPKKFQLSAEFPANDRGYSFAELWHQFSESRRNNMGTARKHARGTTLSSYWRDLSPYFEFLKGKGHSHWNDVTEEDTMEFISHTTTRVSERTGKRLSKASLMHIWRSLKALMRFIAHDANCRRKGMLPHLEAIPNIPVNYRDPKQVYVLPSPEEVKQFLASLNLNLMWDRRDYIMAMLILDCGASIGELCFLRLDHLKRISQGLLDLKGKRGRRTVNITSSRATMLEEWLRLREKQGPEHEYVFFSVKGAMPFLRQNEFDGQLEPDQSAIDQAFQRHSKSSGVKITPYTLRHYFATHYLRRGGKVEDLKELMGHTNLEMLNVYVHMAQQFTHLAEQQAKFSPAAELDEMSGEKKRPKSTRQGKKKLFA